MGAACKGRSAGVQDLARAGPRHQPCPSLVPLLLPLPLWPLSVLRLLLCLAPTGRSGWPAARTLDAALQTPQEGPCLFPFGVGAALRWAQGS